MQKICCDSAAVLLNIGAFWCFGVRFWLLLHIYSTISMNYHNCLLKARQKIVCIASDIYTVELNSFEINIIITGLFVICRAHYPSPIYWVPVSFLCMLIVGCYTRNRVSNFEWLVCLCTVLIVKIWLPSGCVLYLLWNLKQQLFDLSEKKKKQPGLPVDEGTGCVRGRSNCKRLQARSGHVFFTSVSRCMDVHDAVEWVKSLPRVPKMLMCSWSNCILPMCVQDDNTTWYHEGPPSLKRARLWIAEYSLPR